ncbi:hypothetical protein [Undibacterium rugosum]|uniref:Uncharacterized protein n=1 Tax=Undibacterium rugosum TaxID=2762291 RepID=A0A923KZ29_9BURK|nr:hypothetical protein [Undibacterium rugosum]MBC3935405.1 hypothetical protein [Undibacterium rugosum]MBR7778820.1 hypothetical protein [Undibacterium rugosum]
MKLSRFFEDLMAVYKAEIDDLKSDSEGKNILKARLREKAEQLPLLLPMMESNPEMLASAFHQGFIFLNPLALEALTAKEQASLPAWKTLATAVRLEPWAEPLAKVVQTEAAGDRFLVIAAVLEYLMRGAQSRRAGSTADAADDTDHDELDDESEDRENGDLDGQYGRHGRDDGDDGDDYDLGEAGADWLAEQGFDRKD